ncbi:MAG: DUF6152 family protein [Gammaproteobacteria bacterium]
MKRQLKAWLPALVLTIALLAPLSLINAHHSFSPLLTKQGEQAIRIFEGSIELYKLLNPHSALIVNLYNENGTVDDWLVELSSSSTLRREGWTDDFLNPRDKVTIAILPFRTGNRGRLRAMLVYGASEEKPTRLIVAYGIRGNTPIMRRLRERLPICGNIQARLARSECFIVDQKVLGRLQEEFPGKMGYVMP